MFFPYCEYTASPRQGCNLKGLKCALSPTACTDEEVLGDYSRRVRLRRSISEAVDIAWWWYSPSINRLHPPLISFFRSLSLLFLQAFYHLRTNLLSFDLPQAICYHSSKSYLDFYILPASIISLPAASDSPVLLHFNKKSLLALLDSSAFC